MRKLPTINELLDVIDNHVTLTHEQELVLEFLKAEGPVIDQKIKRYFGKSGALMICPYASRCTSEKKMEGHCAHDRPHTKNQGCEYSCDHYPKTTPTACVPYKPNHINE